MYAAGSPRYERLTGCLPPCEHDVYEVQPRVLENALMMRGIGENATGVGVSLPSTSRVVVRDALLYGVDDLVGDIGGYLGMFLGVSLVTMYQGLAALFQWALGKRGK